MEPSRDCPKFNRCGVNKCPLHPHYQTLDAAPGDAETKCGLSKRKRQAISSGHPGVLPFDGLTGKEYRGARAWASRSEDDKRRVIEAGQNALKRG